MLRKKCCLLLLLFCVSSCSADRVTEKKETDLHPGHPARYELKRPAFTAEQLRCEYLIDPLGIDVKTPRLSWRLATQDPLRRGLKQTAYHILVADNPERLAQDNGNRWDSGTVASAKSQHIAYKGKPLATGMQCFWKVRVRDEKGLWSPWSTPARWSMGILSSSEWKGKWIGTRKEFTPIKKLPPASDDKVLTDPWLRTTFTFEEKPKHALIHIASVGYHELYVNGKKAHDTVLAPCVSDHTQHARYVTYDITGHLAKGKNALGIWLGVSWSVFPLYQTEDKPRTPIATAQARITFPSGKQKLLITDETWKTHPSPNMLLGTWMFMNYGGELYDARKEIPGWSEASFDDTSWQPVAVYHPRLKLSAELLEPNRKVKLIRPVSITKTGEQTYRADMGVNLAGIFEIDVKGAPGELVEFLFSEREDQECTHKIRSACIIGPDGTCSFTNRFNYSVGQWVVIKGIDYEPSLDDIRAHLVRPDYRRTARFECSSVLLNRIFETTLWTFENLSLGGYVVDCPQRERMGYGGDANATTETALSSFALGAFYTKWAQDWRDVQGSGPVWGLGAQMKSMRKRTSENTGNLPYTAPTYWGGGGPAWSGFCVVLPWEVYKHYGDRRILQENFSMIESWLAFLETKAKDNMLARWGGKWDFLGDWLWPGAEGVNGDTRETLFFNNCFWIYNLQTAAKIAQVIGHKKSAAKYKKRAEEVRRQVHQEFYNAETGGYVNNMQAYLAIALLVDLPPENLEKRIWKRFENQILTVRDGHFWGGITGGSFIVKTLVDYDRPDLMYEMASKTTYPGWGDMLQRGATTLWESWDGGKSLLHSSYVHVGSWFAKGLAGIQPDVAGGAGFKHFLIKPAVLQHYPLKHFSFEYDSPYGMIRSIWKLERGNHVMHVTVPPNTICSVFVPTPVPESVTENGEWAGKAEGVTYLHCIENYTVFQVEPGSYTFKADGFIFN